MNELQVPYFFIGIGSVIILVHLSMLMRRWIFQRRAKKTEGKIVDMIYRRYYYPVVTFVTDQGKELRIQYHIGTNPPIVRVGSQIKVYYLPQQPEKILLPLDIVTGSLYFIIFLISLACIVLGGLLLMM